MDKKKVVVILLYGCLAQVVIARLDLLISSNVCGKEYDMEEIGEEAYVTYKGEWLDNEDCTVEFVNYQVYSKQTCIKPQVFEIGCSTVVEYWRSFVSKYLDPTRHFSCGNPSFDEWCGPLRTTRFTLLFRKSDRNRDDDIQMRLYLQRYPGDDDDDNLSTDSKPFIPGILLGVFSFLILIGVVVFLVCMCSRAQRRRSLPRTQYMCQTANNPMNLQTGQNVPMNAYQPTQQAQLQPANPGNYQMHPMQSAYPSTPQNSSTEYPPAYESLVK